MVLFDSHNAVVSRRKGGAFDESLNAVHQFIHVNTDNSFRDAEEDAASKCKERANGECSPDFAINGNNTLLWEVHCKNCILFIVL